jgi:hypothetical protein
MSSKFWDLHEALGKTLKEGFGEGGSKPFYFLVAPASDGNTWEVAYSEVPVLSVGAQVLADGFSTVEDAKEWAEAHKGPNEEVVTHNAPLFKGAGAVARGMQKSSGVSEKKETCSLCKGTGKHQGKQCTECLGRGSVKIEPKSGLQVEESYSRGDKVWIRHDGKISDGTVVSLSGDKIKVQWGTGTVGEFPIEDVHSAKDADFDSFGWGGKLSETNGPVKNLECAVCGGPAKGRQWWNRDRGYGVCPKCIDWMKKRGTSDEEIEDLYGKKGVHWGVENSDKAVSETNGPKFKKGDTVHWFSRGELEHGRIVGEAGEPDEAGRYWWSVENNGHKSVVADQIMKAGPGKKGVSEAGDEPRVNWDYDRGFSDGARGEEADPEQWQCKKPKMYHKGHAAGVRWAKELKSDKAVSESKDIQFGDMVKVKEDPREGVVTMIDANGQIQVTYQNAEVVLVQPSEVTVKDKTGGTPAEKEAKPLEVEKEPKHEVMGTDGCAASADESRTLYEDIKVGDKVEHFTPTGDFGAPQWRGRTFVEEIKNEGGKVWYSVSHYDKRGNKKWTLDFPANKIRPAGSSVDNLPREGYSSRSLGANGSSFVDMDLDTLVAESGVKPYESKSLMGHAMDGLSAILEGSYDEFQPEPNSNAPLKKGVSQDSGTKDYMNQGGPGYGRGLKGKKLGKELSPEDFNKLTVGTLIAGKTEREGRPIYNLYKVSKVFKDDPELLYIRYAHGSDMGKDIALYNWYLGKGEYFSVQESLVGVDGARSEERRLSSSSDEYKGFYLDYEHYDKDVWEVYIYDKDKKLIKVLRSKDAKYEARQAVDKLSKSEASLDSKSVAESVEETLTGEDVVFSRDAVDMAVQIGKNFAGKQSKPDVVAGNLGSHSVGGGAGFDSLPGSKKLYNILSALQIWLWFGVTQPDNPNVVSRKELFAGLKPPSEAMTNWFKNLNDARQITIAKKAGKALGIQLEESFTLEVLEQFKVEQLKAIKEGVVIAESVTVPFEIVAWDTSKLVQGVVPMHYAKMFRDKYKLESYQARFGENWKWNKEDDTMIGEIVFPDKYKAIKFYEDNQMMHVSALPIEKEAVEAVRFTWGALEAEANKDMPEVSQNNLDAPVSGPGSKPGVTVGGAATGKGSARESVPGRGPSAKYRAELQQGNKERHELNDLIQQLLKNPVGSGAEAIKQQMKSDFRYTDQEIEGLIKTWGKGSARESFEQEHGISGGKSIPDTVPGQTVFNYESAPSAVEKINAGVKAPSVNAALSALSNPKQATVMIRVVLDPKEKWGNGIWQNARFLLFSFEQNGTLELFNKFYNIEAKFRKTRVKSVDDAINKINQFVQVAGEARLENNEAVLSQGKQKISLKAILDLANKISSGDTPWIQLDKEFKKLTGKTMLKDETTMSSFGQSFLAMAKLSRVTSPKTLQDWSNRNDLSFEIVESEVFELELSVPDRHQLSIAKKTLRMPDEMADVAGGPNKAEAREILKTKFGYSDAQIAKLEESASSAMGLPSSTTEEDTPLPAPMDEEDPDMMIGDSEENEEPDTDNDVFYQSYGQLGADGGFFYGGKEVAKTEEELKSWMEQQRYWPSVWNVSDHGNVSPYTMDEAVLTTAARKHIAPSNFAFPKDRRYPMHDLSHAQESLVRVAQSGTNQEKAVVRRKVSQKYPSLGTASETRTQVEYAVTEGELCDKCVNTLVAFVEKKGITADAVKEGVQSALLVPYAWIELPEGVAIRFDPNAGILELKGVREDYGGTVDAGDGGQEKTNDQPYHEKQGRITSPGKFEGEMYYVPNFWDMANQGFADLDGGGGVVFKLGEEDWAKYPELKGMTALVMAEDSDGFMWAEARNTPWAEVEAEFNKSMESQEEMEEAVIREVMGYSLSGSDRLVIKAFLKGEDNRDYYPSQGKNLFLDEDGKVLRSSWEDNLATRTGANTIKMGAASGNVSQTWINAIRKMAKAEGVVVEGVTERIPADDFQDGWMDSESGIEAKHRDNPSYMMGYNSKKTGVLGGTPGRKSSQFFGKADRTRRGRAEAADKGSYEPDKAYAAKSQARVGEGKVEDKMKKEILSGRTFTTPGATEEARREPFYCSQLTVPNCRDCSLVNYGKDCHNNSLDPHVEMPSGWHQDAVARLKKGYAWEGKLPKDQTNDQLEAKMAAMLEAMLDPGVIVRVRDNRSNQEIHPELVGKTGQIVQSHHEKQGLYLDVQLEGEESPSHFDWRDVEVVEKKRPGIYPQEDLTQAELDELEALDKLAKDQARTIKPTRIVPKEKEVVAPRTNEKEEEEQTTDVMDNFFAVADKLLRINESKKVAHKVTCPKCGKEVWDVAKVGQSLNKCWGCGLRFETDEEADAPAWNPPARKVSASASESVITEFKQGDQVRVQDEKAVTDLVSPIGFVREQIGPDAFAVELSTKQGKKVIRVFASSQLAGVKNVS